MVNHIVISSQSPEPGLTTVATDGQPHPGGTGKAIQAATDASFVKMHKYSEDSPEEVAALNGISSDTWVHITGHGSVGGEGISGLYETSTAIAVTSSESGEKTTWDLNKYADKIASSEKIKPGDTINIMMWVCKAGNEAQGLSMAQKLAMQLANKAIKANIIACTGDVVRYTGTKSAAELKESGIQYKPQSGDVVLVRSEESRLTTTPLNLQGKMILKESGPVVVDKANKEIPLRDVLESVGTSKAIIPGVTKEFKLPTLKGKTHFLITGNSSKSHKKGKGANKVKVDLLEPYRSTMMADNIAMDEKLIDGMMHKKLTVSWRMHSKHPNAIVIGIHNPDYKEKNRQIYILELDESHGCFIHKERNENTSEKNRPNKKYKTLEKFVSECIGGVRDPVVEEAIKYELTGQVGVLNDLLSYLGTKK